VLEPFGCCTPTISTTQTIIDYSFFGVNHDTLALAPDECMQFEKTLWSMLLHLKSANTHLGNVRARDVPEMGVLFPSTTSEEYLVGFLLALPMG
jgi:hypothetical protein